MRMVPCSSITGVMHRGVEMSARISSTVGNDIREPFEKNPRITLLEIASEKLVAHAKVWSILRRTLKLSPYKLQISTAL